MNPNPVIERHGGITVVREDLCCADLPSGKLRGVLAWFTQLRESGARGVVNHAVSYSNSHAIVGYAARACGLVAVSYVNCKYPTPQTVYAESLGVRMVYSGPKQLGPLRGHARRHDEPGFRQIPWALSHRDAYASIVDMVGRLSPNEHTRHVVAIGGGGYAYAVDAALKRFAMTGRVVGVPTSGATEQTCHKRVSAFNPLHDVVFAGGVEQMETPFPSDPHYEWHAWPVALMLSRRGHDVCFWNVGRPIC